MHYMLIYLMMAGFLSTILRDKGLGLLIYD